MVWSSKLKPLRGVVQKVSAHTRTEQVRTEDDSEQLLKPKQLPVLRTMLYEN